MTSSNPDPLQQIVQQTREIYARIQSSSFDYEAERATLLVLRAQLGDTDWAGHSIVSTMLGILSVYAGHVRDSIGQFVAAVTAYEHANDFARAAMVRANRAEAHRYLQEWDDALDQIRIAQEMTLSHQPQDTTGALLSLKVNAASLHLVLRHDELATLTLRSIVRERIEQPSELQHSVFFQAYRMLALIALIDDDLPLAAEHVMAAQSRLSYLPSPMMQMSWFISAYVLATLAPDSMPGTAAVYGRSVQQYVVGVPSALTLLTLAGEAQDLIAVQQPAFARWLLDLGRDSLPNLFTPDLHELYAALQRRLPN